MTAGSAARAQAGEKAGESGGGKGGGGRTDVRPLGVRQSHDDPLGVVRPGRRLEARRERGRLDGKRVIAGHLVLGAARDAGKEGVADVAHGAQPPVDRRRGAADGRAVDGGEGLVPEADAQHGEGGAVLEDLEADADVGALVRRSRARRDDHCGRRASDERAAAPL